MEAKRGTNLVERKLAAVGRHTMLLDGDNLRQGLNADLGFDAACRSENVRPVGETARLVADADLIVMAALMSPFRANRARAAALMPDGRFLEVFVDTPLETCRRRDVKDRKAESGRISNVTGLDQPYEPPDAPAVVLRATDMEAGDAANLVSRLVVKKV